MEQELQAQLATGIVELSQAMAGAPLHMVRKESSASGYRFCIDFTETNMNAIAEPCPLHTIQTVQDSVSGANLFANLIASRILAISCSSERQA